MRIARYAAGAVLASALGADLRAAAEEPSAPLVLSLDHRGGFGRRRTTDEPYLQILADGTVRAPDLVGSGEPFTARLTTEETQALVVWVLVEQRFPEITAADIVARMRQRQADASLPTVVDAGATVVEARWGERRHAVSIHALSVALREFPDVEPLRRFHAIVERLENVHAVARAGGPRGAVALVKAANDALAREAPLETPFAPADLRFLGVDAAATRWTYRLRRTHPPAPAEGRGGRTVVALVTVPRQGAPTVHVSVHPVD